jgi:23S rRNA (uracil1939-C5)-methyltransferase
VYNRPVAAPYDEVEITVTELDDLGRGVGIAATPPGASGRPLEVHTAQALPGERVRVALEHRSPHGPRAWGKTVALLGPPSGERVTPACPGFGRCGGCELQHLSIAGQGRAKAARITRAFASAGVVPPVPIEPVVPSPLALGYRNKAKYVLVAAPSGGLCRASYEPASHRPVPMAGCLVPEPPLDEVAQALCDALARTGLSAYDEPRHTGELRHLVVRKNHRGEILALVITRTGAGRPALAAAAETVARAWPQLVGVVRQVNPARGGAVAGNADDLLWGRATLIDRIGDAELRLGAGSFFQVNRAQAEALYAHVCAELDAGGGGGARLVDLYCGVGGIALTLALAGARVAGIESHAGAIADAQASAQAAGLGHLATFHLADATQGLLIARAELGAIDGVVVNPPRKGLSAGALASVAAAPAPVLVYVSCGPESLARDLAALVAAGTTISRVRPFDLMPGTAQVETVVTLRRG